MGSCVCPPPALARQKRVGEAVQRHRAIGNKFKMLWPLSCREEIGGEKKGLFSKGKEPSAAGAGPGAVGEPGPGAAGAQGDFWGRKRGCCGAKDRCCRWGQGWGFLPEHSAHGCRSIPPPPPSPRRPASAGTLGTGSEGAPASRPPFCGRRVIYDMRGGAIVWTHPVFFSEGFASLPSPPLCRCYCTVAMGRAPRAAAMRGSAGEGRAPRPDPSGAPQPRCRQHPRAAPLTCRGPGNGAFGPSKFTATGGIQLPGGQRDPGRLAPFSLPLRLSAAAVSSAHTDPPVPFSS